MNRENIPEFTAMLNGLASMYGKPAPSDFALQLWMNAMMPYDIATVRKAFTDHVMNPDVGQFMPKPADIVRAVDGGTEDRALKAWADVRTAIGAVGAWNDAVFPDPVIHRVISDMGGWPEICMRKENEIDFVRNEFVKRYRSDVAKPGVPVHPKILTGLANRVNASNGTLPNPPVLIGDVEKARRVISTGSSKPSLSVFLQPVRLLPAEAK